MRKLTPNSVIRNVRAKLRSREKITVTSPFPGKFPTRLVAKIIFRNPPRGKARKPFVYFGIPSAEILRQICVWTSRGIINWGNSMVAEIDQHMQTVTVARDINPITFVLGEARQVQATFINDILYAAYHPWNSAPGRIPVCPELWRGQVELISVGQIKGGFRPYRPAKTLSATKQLEPYKAYMKALNLTVKGYGRTARDKAKVPPVVGGEGQAGRIV